VFAMTYAFVTESSAFPSFTTLCIVSVPFPTYLFAEDTNRMFVRILSANLTLMLWRSLWRLWDVVHSCCFDLSAGTSRFRHRSPLRSDRRTGWLPWHMSQRSQNLSQHRSSLRNLLSSPLRVQPSILPSFLHCGVEPNWLDLPLLDVPGVGLVASAHASVRMIV